MLFQFPEILSYIIAYVPTAIYTCFYVAMLIFGYLIRKKNRYTYGTFFIISAIFSITSSIIFYALNSPMLVTFLYIDLNLPFSLISVILTLVNLLFLSLNLTSAIFLFIALYFVYKTHKSPRVEPNTN